MTMNCVEWSKWRRGRSQGETASEIRKKYDLEVKTRRKWAQYTTNRFFKFEFILKSYTHRYQ